MNMLFFVVVVVVVVVASECDWLRNDVRVPERAVVLPVPNSPPRMLLYREARNLVALWQGRPATLAKYDVALAVACESQQVGLAFAGYVAGMDCLARLVAEHQGTTTTTTTARRTEALLRAALAWQRQGLCRPWTDDYPGLAAALFWGAVAGCLWTVMQIRRIRRM